jgi:hypothetical protein
MLMNFIRLGLCLLFAGLAFAQPNCQINFTFVAAGNSTVWDNRQKGCIGWTVAYNNTGYSALSITVQTAPNSSGSPGAWSTFTAASGSNPNTAITQASSTFDGYFPFLRVNLAGLTGSGTVSGTLYGYLNPAGGGSSGGGVCSAAGPCPVVGVDAAGAAPTVAPVSVGGSDGALMRRLLLDTGGRTIVVGAAASAAALAGSPVRVGLSDGTNAQNWLTMSSLGDTDAGTGVGAAGTMLYNGTNYSRWRGTTNGGFVQGPVATGSALGGNPVRVGGSDGTNVRNLLTDASGGLRVASVTYSFSDGASNSFQAQLGTNSATVPLTPPVYSFVYNPGNDWNRQRGSTAGTLMAGLGTTSGGLPVYYSIAACDQTAVVSVTAGATTQIVALTASQRVRICGYQLSISLTGTAQWVTGTGSNCGTGTANVSGVIDLTTAMPVS